MAKKKPKPPKPEPKYSWTRTGDKVTCSKGKGGQTVIKLWEAEEYTAFHDTELAQATREINAILSKLERNNKDRERTPSFIEFQNRHFLVWATYGAVGPDDDDATIIKALKLKSK
jgi:hypothetical protein